MDDASARIPPYTLRIAQPFRHVDPRARLTLGGPAVRPDDPDAAVNALPPRRLGLRVKDRRLPDGRLQGPRRGAPYEHPAGGAASRDPPNSRPSSCAAYTAGSD